MIDPICKEQLSSYIMFCKELVSRIPGHVLCNEVNANHLIYYLKPYIRDLIDS